MSIREVPRRFCDRPGCDNPITAKGCESAGLTTGGLRRVTIASVHSSIEDEPDAEPDAGTARDTAPDLCRECVESAETWWTSKQRRQRTLFEDKPGA